MKTNLKIVTLDGEVVRRWPRLESKVIVGGSMATLGTIGLAVLLVYSPYRLVVLGVSSIFLLTYGWQVLTGKLRPRPPGGGQVIHHYHHRRFF